MDNFGEAPAIRVRLESGAHTPLLYLLLPLIAGFALAAAFPHDRPSQWLLVFAAALTTVATLGAMRRRTQGVLILWGACFMATSALAGWYYYALRIPAPPDLAAMANREAGVEIRIDRVFALKSHELRVAGIGELVTAPDYAPRLVGQRIYFQCWKDDITAPVGRGGVIFVRGKLEPTPDDPEGFDGYLRQQGCYLKLSQASLKDIVTPQPWLYAKFAAINERWQEILQTGANSPRTQQLAGIATAMLLGEKTALTTDQKERFIASGTMHLFAVSGLHVGIVAGLLLGAMKLIRVPTKWAPFIGLALLMGYVQVTGAAPSAIRAWWMACFFWLAFALMRKPQPLSALVSSALVVLLIDPRQLWSAGFQLSYTVVAGLIMYGGPLQFWLRNRFEPWRHIFPEERSRWQRFGRFTTFALYGLVAISFAASLYSAPLTIRYFGVLAPGSFLLNIPLVTLAPLAMTASLIAVLLGWAGWAAGAAFANHASWVFIAGMDGLVRLFLQTPESSLTLMWRWSWGGYALAVLMLAAALCLADRRIPPWARFGAPPLIMLLGLVFGAELHHIESL